MNSTDKDGLSPSQIRRIDRLKMSRHRKQKLTGTEMAADVIGILFLAVVAWAIINFAFQRHWSRQTDLITSLPNLDQQAPSITIYGN